MYRGRLRKRGREKKKGERERKRNGPKFPAKPGSSTISHMEKFPPLFAHRRRSLERGKRNAARLQVSRVFPPLFPTSVVHEGESWKRWDKQNRYRTEGTRRDSKRRIEPFLPSPPRIFVQNFRSVLQHASKISLPPKQNRTKRDIHVKKKRKEKKEKNHSSIAHRTAIRGKGQRVKRGWSVVVEKKTRRRKRKMKERTKRGGGETSGKRAESGEYYYTRSKFISGHPGGRNRRGQIPSRASPSSFAKPVRNLHPRRPLPPVSSSPRSPPRWLGSLLPPSPLYPPFDWRDKSLRLTGSRRITGTGDIYARLAHRPGHYP